MVVDHADNSVRPTYRIVAGALVLPLAVAWWPRHLPLVRMVEPGLTEGMTEFVVMGLLPDIAQDLLPALWAESPESAIAQSGWLITLYALAVVIGAPLVTIAAVRMPRAACMPSFIAA